MARLKLLLIQIADWIDDHILDHRFYRICCLISDSEWWDEGDAEEAFRIREALRTIEGIASGSIPTIPSEKLWDALNSDE